MLTIECAGAQALLGLLRRMGEGFSPGEQDLDEVLAANAYFVDFYVQWDGCDREAIKSAIQHLDQPECAPSGTLAARLAEGFRQASRQLNLLEGRLTWVQAIEPSSISARVLPFLPVGTPLDSTVHITVDPLNNAFAYQRDARQAEMGVSLLKGMADRETFEDAIAHELHHVGVQHWRTRDPTRQRLARERSGRAVAVLHVENLLSEGTANYYCTPRYVFGEPSTEPPVDPYQRRLARLRKEEKQLLARAEAVLAGCLEPGAEYAASLEAFKAMALDTEEFMLPAAHYLGARMVQTMERVYPRDDVLECVRDLAAFLPLYSTAASTTGGFVFGAQVVEEFARLLKS